MNDVSMVFIDDLTVEGMLHCAVIRSRIRRGTIREITVPELPPNVVMIRPEDFQDRNYISIGGAQIPVLAQNVVEHAGQAIALLCGEDELQLQHLAGKIEIQYDRGDPLSLTRDFKIDQERYTREISTGNVSAAYDRAFQIAEGEYRYEPVGRAPLSATGALAVADNNGIQIATPTKWAFHVRDSVAEVLGLELDAVQVKCTRVCDEDPHYLWYTSITAAQAAVAARITGKPVRIIATSREKQLLFTRKGGCIISHRTALGQSDNILGMEIQIVAESGAFGIFAEEYLDRLCFAASGYYSAKAVKIEGIHIKTSLPPSDTHGGIGFDGGFFALEIHATRLAELCGEDPSEWRLKNLLNDRSLTMTRARAGSTPQRRLLESVVERSDYRRKYSANETLKKHRLSSNHLPDYLRGIGIATCFHGGGFINNARANSATATVSLSAESRLNIMSSTGTIPENSAGIYTESAARILNLPESDIRIEPSDT
jgi:xanthine dehydrogenase large subunit